MMRALERPRAGDHGRQCGGAPRQLADRLLGNAGDLGRPLGIFYGAVVKTKQVAAKLVEADAVARDELGIVAFLDNQRMREREHQRGVGVRPNGYPLRFKKVRRVRFEWTYRNKLDAGRLGPAQPNLQAVHAGAA